MKTKLRSGFPAPTFEMNSGSKESDKKNSQIFRFSDSRRDFVYRGDLRLFSYADGRGGD
jgi:hypothetical protein